MIKKSQQPKDEFSTTDKPLSLKDKVDMGCKILLTSSGVVTTGVVVARFAMEIRSDDPGKIETREAKD